jgi:hypothetical protein
VLRTKNKRSRWVGGALHTEDGGRGGAGIRQKPNELQAGIEGVLRTKKIRRSRWVGGAPEKKKTKRSR